MSQQATISTIGGPKTIRQRLATPRAVMIVLPALVALVGVVSGVVSYRSMSASARSMALEGVELAVDQVVHQCDNLAVTAGRVAERTQVLLDRNGSEGGVEAWSPDLASLFAGRPALSWVSVSTPGGVFFGMTREEGGRLRYTLQDQEAGGTRRDWYVDGETITDGGVRTQTGYDPRKRPFYVAAVEKRGPAWTDPYTFFDTGHTGVSLATPVYSDGGDLRAVVTIDFTAADISKTLERLAGSLGDRLVVHDAKGAVIAAAGTTVKGRETGRDKPLALADLGDPLIDAYTGFAEASGTVMARDGRECLVARRSTADDGLPWTVAVVADLRPRLAVANRQLTRTALITLAVVVAACVLAALYASHLVRMRGIVRAARADAARAQEEAAELGSYVLEKKLGAGGMGEVWRARHRLLARPAALKLIKRDSEVAEEETGAQRFEREARLTASLTSPHTVTVYDFGQLEDGTLFYAMELLEGEDLDGILRRHGKLPQEAVVHVLIQVCDSLHEAHEAGLVHRDLKPANIFVARRGCADDVAKVLDFGLVALAGKRQKTEGPRLTMAGFVQGTPGYMSPEQLRDEELDRRSDLYSLGCVAFWLLTGRAVFPADNLMDELRRHLDEDPPAPSKVAGQPVGEGLDQVILALLARDKAKRPASAADLRRLLLTCGVPPKWAPDLGGGRQSAIAAGETTGAAKQVRVKRGKKG